MGDSHAVDTLLQVLAVAGGRRCINFRRHNTSTLPPPDRPPEWGAQLAQRWKAECSAKQMQVYHTELLRCAEAFLNFMDSNVGTTEEYPIVVQAETEESMEVFRDQLSKLRNPVNFLLEI